MSSGTSDIKIVNMEAEASAVSSSLENFCNLLSLTVVVLCVIMKLPQLWNVIKAGDTQGISAESVILEQTGYSIVLSYNFAMGYPLPTYMETAFLLFQNFVLIGLIIHTRNLLSFKVVLAFIIYMIVYMSIGYRLVPDVMLSIVISLGIPMSVSSKAAQILDLYRKQDPGRLSALTWSIAGYGCYVRILTNIVQTGDIFIIVNFASGAVLNTVIVAMIFYYRQQQKSKLF